MLCGAAYDLLAASDAAIIASGTATLEAALLETPMVVVYRVNRLTYEIGRRVIRVPFIALANLVAGELVVPERIQEQATPSIIAADVVKILDQPQHAEQMRAGLRKVREALSPPPERASDVVAMLLERVLRGESIRA